MCSGPSTKVSKNHVVWARCHLVGLASGIDCTVWSSALSGAASRSVSDRTAQNSPFMPSILPQRAGNQATVEPARTQPN